MNNFDFNEIIELIECDTTIQTVINILTYYLFLSKVIL